MTATPKPISKPDLSACVIVVAWNGCTVVHPDGREFIWRGKRVWNRTWEAQAAIQEAKANLAGGVTK